MLFLVMKWTSRSFRELRQSRVLFCDVTRLCWRRLPWLWMVSTAVRDARNSAAVVWFVCESLCVCVRIREGTVRVKTAHKCRRIIFIKHFYIYMCLLRHLSHNTHTILFTGLDFGSGHSRAAFISVCLDTIYHRLFILLSVCLYVFLFVWLWAHGCWIFRQSRVVCGVTLVCHPPPPLCGCHVPKEEVSLSFFSATSSHHPFLACVWGSRSGCDGLRARLGFDHDLLLKPCGISSLSQAAMTTVNLTLLLTVCRSSSPGYANTCMFTDNWDTKWTCCFSPACT